MSVPTTLNDGGWRDRERLDWDLNPANSRETLIAISVDLERWADWTGATQEDPRCVAMVDDRFE